MEKLMVPELCIIIEECLKADFPCLYTQNICIYSVNCTQQLLHASILSPGGTMELRPLSMCMCLVILIITLAY